MIFGETLLVPHFGISGIIMEEIVFGIVAAVIFKLLWAAQKTL